MTDIEIKAIKIFFHSIQANYSINRSQFPECFQFKSSFKERQIVQIHSELQKLISLFVEFFKKIQNLKLFKILKQIFEIKSDETHNIIKQVLHL